MKDLLNGAIENLRDENKKMSQEIADDDINNHISSLQEKMAALNDKKSADDSTASNSTDTPAPTRSLRGASDVDARNLFEVRNLDAHGNNVKHHGRGRAHFFLKIITRASMTLITPAKRSAMLAVNLKIIPACTIAGVENIPF